MISQFFTNIGISCDIIYQILHVISCLDVNCELESKYPSVQVTKSGVAMKAVLKLSEHHLVVYMEGLLAVCPYVNCPFDFCAKRVAEAVAAIARQRT
jgi:hypothetical protein